MLAMCVDVLVYYSQNITMTLFTVLSFCACCFICRLYLHMDCLLSFYARPMFYVLCNGVRMSHCIKGYLTWLDLCSALSVDGTLVKPVRSARDLGIYTHLDANLVMRTVSRCFAVLRQLRHIRHSVPTYTFQTLVVSLVLTRLDYGNGVLAGLPVYLVRRLQSVLNAAGRWTYHLRRSDHITDALACLHWLRVPDRIEFKIAVLTISWTCAGAPQPLYTCRRPIHDKNVTDSSLCSSGTCCYKPVDELARALLLPSHPHRTATVPIIRNFPFGVWLCKCFFSQSFMLR